MPPIKKNKPVSPRKRPWVVTSLGLLLVLQAVGFPLVGAAYLSWLDLGWEFLPQNVGRDALSIVIGAVFLALGVLAWLTAIGFFRLWAESWLSAIALQGLNLLMAILLYFQEKPFFAYLLMAYGIFMVIYLNYSEVAAAFRPAQMASYWSSKDEL